MQKFQPVQIEPVEEDNIIEVKTVSKPQKIQNTDSKNSNTGENNLIDENIEEIENLHPHFNCRCMIKQHIWWTDKNGKIVKESEKIL